MMRLILLLSLFVAFNNGSHLFAQGEENPYPKDFRLVMKEHRVKSVTITGGLFEETWSEEFYDEEGNLDVRFSYDETSDSIPKYVTSYVYLNGQLQTVREVKHGVLQSQVLYTYTKDLLTEKIHIFYGDEISSDTIFYEYDEAGRLIQETTDEFFTRYAYDEKGKMTSRDLIERGERVVGDAKEIFTYDSGGRKASSQTKSGFGNQKSTWGYDLQGRLTLEVKQMEIGGFGSQRHQFGYWYREDGLLDKIKWERSGISGSPEVFETHYQYSFYE